MKVFIDFEFDEDGETIKPIALGAVRCDLAQFYAEFEGVDLSRVNPWVAEHVVPLLKGNTTPREEIAAAFLEFVGPEPEFWAYYGAYDWVALCQMYGPMIDLPPGWPMFCRDLQQFGEDLDLDLDAMLPQDLKHNALGDAWWNHRAYHYALEELKGRES